ncbi:MAG: RNA polymerase sigma factor [Woeseiaceae bacterium]
MPDGPDNATLDELPDRELVGAFLRARGEHEFRVLYRRHTPALHRMACRLVGASRAEDIVQETWCRAARNVGKFEWRSALRTWLTAILIRCCRETWHDERNVRPLPVGEIVEEPEVEVRGSEMLDLERALEALPPGFREVLVLHDVEGFTHEEIARSLNVVPGTSKSQLARARKALRQRLESTPLPSDNDEAAR